MTIVDFVWTQLPCKFKDVIMYKVPVYIAIIAVALVSYGCTKYLCAKPEFNHLAQLVADADRIAKKELSEKDLFAKMTTESDAILALAQKDPVGNAKLIEKIKAYKVAEDAYKKAKLTNGKFRIEYFGIAIDEYFEIWRVIHGTLPDSMEKAYKSAKESNSEALKKFQE